MQVAAHEVSEKIKRLPGKVTHQQSLLSDMESEYESDNDPRSPSDVSSGNAYMYHKRSSTSYSLVSMNRNYSLIICTIFATCRRLRSRIKNGIMNLKHGC